MTTHHEIANDAPFYKRLKLLFLRPQMWAVTRESFVMQIATVLDFLDVKHQIVADVFAERKSNALRIEDLTTAIDDAWCTTVRAHVERYLAAAERSPL